MQINWLCGIYNDISYIYRSSVVQCLCMSFYKIGNLLQTSTIKAKVGYHQNQKNRHNHEHNKKHVTKQQGNNDPSSTLFMNKFTPKPCFLKF